MVSAINSATFASYATAGRPAVNLEAQLDRLKAQLADWVNCPSCNTIEGKTKIAEISGKISEIVTQMKSADDAKIGNSAATADSNIFADNKASNVISATDSVKSTSSSLPVGPLGSRLDIFA
jgi:hypothetical protein